MCLDQGHNAVPALRLERNKSLVLTNTLFHFLGKESFICFSCKWTDTLPGISGLNRTAVLKVSDEVIPKPACSVTETSKNSETSLVASCDMILFNKRITKALIRLRGCSQTPPKR